MVAFFPSGDVILAHVAMRYKITISFGLFNRSLHEPKAQMMCFGMKRINLLRFQRRLSNYGTI